MKVLDLFSGIGGFSLGLERAGMKTVAFCEIDPFCQKVLNKHWPGVPIYDDIRTIRNQFTGTVDLICGGFPCQPFSVAGKQKGKDDDRHLWPEMLACIKHYRPRWVIGENVAGFINMALDDVLFDLESEGYECRTFVIPACAVNAPHRRDRVWIVGYSEHNGRATASQQGIFTKTNDHKQKRQNKNSEFTRPGSAWQRMVAHSNNERCERSISKAIQGFTGRTRKFERSFKEWRNGWPISKSRVCGVDDGIPNRTHRLIALGNAVVPQIPEIIGHAIMEIETIQPPE